MSLEGFVGYGEYQNKNYSKVVPVMIGLMRKKRVFTCQTQEDGRRLAGSYIV